MIEKYLASLTVGELIAWVLGIIGLFQIYIMFFFERKNIISGLKGKDLRWQFVELSGIVWLVMFPILLVASLLGNSLLPHEWLSIDFLYAANLGSRNLDNWIKNKYARQSEDTKEQEQG